MKICLIIVTFHLIIVSISFSQNLKEAKELAKENLTLVLNNTQVPKEKMDDFDKKISKVRPFLFVGRKQKNNLNTFYYNLRLYDLEFNSSQSRCCEKLITHFCNYDTLYGIVEKDIKFNSISLPDFKSFEISKDENEPSEKEFRRASHNDFIGFLSVIDSVNQKMWNNRIEKLLMFNYHFKLQDNFNIRIKSCINEKYERKRRLVTLRENLILLSRNLKI